MNIGNILNRRLGLITVPNLQKVINNLLEIIGLVDGAIPDSRPYKVYSALLTQTGTSDPVATVLENTLDGVPIWTRDSIGIYVATLASAFTADKTWLSITPNWTVGDSGGTPKVERGSSNDIQVVSYATDQSGIDGLFSNTPIEIRVYN
jgi:hypothetical protein